MRVNDDSYANLINAFRKRERDLGTKVDEDKRQRRFKAYPGSDLHKDGGKKERGRGNGDTEKVPMMPKFLFSSLTHIPTIRPNHYVQGQ